jgi:MOSC domain
LQPGNEREGKGMAQMLEGRVVEVLIGRAPPQNALEPKLASPDADYLVTTPVPKVRVILEGFEGDRHAGFTRQADNRTPFYPRGTVIGNSRQVSIVSVEELAEMAAALGVPRIEAAWLGANLVIEGVPRLSKLPAMLRLFFSEEATLQVTAENHPCVFPGKAIQRRYPEITGLAITFPKRALGLRGLVAWVERPGMISTGDTVRIEDPGYKPIGSE